ncbi:hypothetical protein CEXT_559001 [Caerostris extrusa]|uniref:Uncharacterized protein n=1 Tax=Caerostris extrusa TaxID=172846 RepID=A0AAV4R5D5_CAEEX|nr:hypothetical protein CEXT_559001 [Caerostris extrusa]
MAATLMRSLGWRTNICGLDFVTLLLRFHYLDWFRLCPQGSTRGLLKVRRFWGGTFFFLSCRRRKMWNVQKRGGGSLLTEPKCDPYCYRKCESRDQ